jgi:hypothetical protein
VQLLDLHDDRLPAPDRARHCGVKSFYVPRSHPDGFSVNGRCLDAGTVSFFHVTPFDDNDREAATAAVAHLTHE